LIGVISALGAASSWTYACHLWREQTKYFSAIEINLIKNIIAFFIFLPVLLSFNFLSNTNEILILMISGFIGIGLGDSFYIVALKKLGTHRTLLIESISPLLATILGSIFLNEIPRVKVWVGVLIVSISLIGVAFNKNERKGDGTILRRENSGFIFALLSVFCAVIAAVLSRFVLVNSNLNPFQTTEIRLFAGLILLLPFAKNSLILGIRSLPLKDRQRVLYASFLGTNLGILLQQNVFQTLPIGIGWTLLSTSPAFSLFYAKAEGEKLNWESLLLTLTTILGVSIALI